MIIGLISDIHQNGHNENKVLEISLKNMAKNGATALIMAGDIGDEHSRREKAFSIINDCFPQEFHNAMMLMLGNHDVRTGVRPDKSLDPDLVNLYHDYLDKFGIHYYDNTMCIDTWFNNYHVLCLNTDQGLKDSMFLNATSLAWLKEKLAEDSDIHKPIIVVTHQSFNSSHWRAGLFGGFGEQDEILKELFNHYPQIILLNGHIHNGLGVIEFIQRPFGTLVEIPSLTKSENGVKSAGTGWLIKTSQETFVFEAWDFFNDKRLSQYDQAINFPQLSVLTQELTDAEKSAPQDLLAKASVLMNKQYLDDMPDGDSTVKGLSDYGINKIYDEDTWIDIEALRHEIIDYLDEEKFYHFPINNGEIIRDVSLRKILNAHDQVLIKMYDGGWTPKIFLPAMDGGNKTIKIITNAGYQTRVYYDKQEVVLKKGDALKVTTRVKWHRV